MFLFFTDILHREIMDRYGRFLGYPFDFTAKFDEPYPRLTSIILSRSRFCRRYLEIPWTDVQFNDEHFSLRHALDTYSIKSEYRRDGVPTLRHNVLDQQVVDTFNRKLVRINDLHLLSVGGELRIAHVDIGIRGLVRRLGWEPAVDFVVRAFNRHATYLNVSSFIGWKYIQPLSIQDAAGKIQLNVDQQTLRSIPPSDISEMLLELDPYQRAALLRTLDVKRQVEIITELDLRKQKDLIEDLDTRTVVELFDRMPADEATDLLQTLSTRDAARIVTELPTRKAREIANLMRHETDSAGGLMTTEYVVLSPDMTVGDTIERIRSFAGRVETTQTSYVLDAERKLIGAVRMSSLLLESNHIRIEEIMEQKPPAIEVNSSVKDIAFLFDKYNLFVAPVVNDQGVLEGIITIDDVLSRVVDETWGERSAL